MAFQADILINVRGFQDISRIQKALEGTARKIDEINTSAARLGAPVRNVERFTRQLEMAARALEKVAIGSPQEQRAIANYVTALNNSNVARDRQNKLIQAEITLRNTTTNAIRANVEANIAESRATRAAREEAQQLNTQLAQQERLRRKLAERGLMQLSGGGVAQGTEAGVGLQGPRLPGGDFNLPAGVSKLAPPPFRGAQKFFAEKPGMADAIIGGAFPLLFGGGPGAVAGGFGGGLAGGAIGGPLGMALSVGLSAVGQQLDKGLKDSLVLVSELSTALKELNMDSLRDSIILVNADLDTTVRQLVAAGQADAARAEVAKQVTLQTGMLPEVVSDITNNTNLLGNTWNEFTGAVSGTLSILSAPFVTALTVIGQGLAKAFQFVTLILGSVGLILKRAVELIAKIPFLQPILKFIEERTKAIAETEEQRLESARQITDQLSKELATNAQLQALESRRTLGRTAAEQIINAQLDSQIQKNRINQEYASKELDLRKQLAATTDPRARAQLDLALQQNEALRAQALKQQEIKDKLFAQGMMIEANNQKYNEAVETINRQIASLERGAQVAQSRYGVEAAQNDLYGAQLQRQYELATTEQQRLQIAVQMFEQQIRAAQIEYEQALLNNDLMVKKAELEARIVELKYKQIEADKQIAIASAMSNGNTSKEIDMITAAYNKSLSFQDEVVQTAREQVASTTEIAQNQNQVADAVYKTRVVQAESALAQKLVSDEIGLSTEAANKLAGELGAGAYTANQLASEMTNVAAQAAYAAQQIQNAINLQNMLNGGGDMNAGSTQAYAEGGYVTGPTQAIVGEGGEPEYVIPASKMSEAMGRYASGARGSSVIPDASNSTTSSYSAGTSSINPVVNVTTGPVMNMNNSNYVSQADFLAGLQAASRQGAQMALATLQNNSSTRRAVGVR